MTASSRLTADQQWIVAYLQNHLASWGDVRNDAVRTLRKVKSKQDFLDWKEYFLPERRYKQAVQALTAYKMERAQKNYSNTVQAQNKLISVPIEEQVAKLLQQRARAAHCSISELLRKKLA